MLKLVLLNLYHSYYWIRIFVNRVFHHFRNPDTAGGQERISSDIDESNIITPNDHLQYKSVLAPKVDVCKYSFFYRVHKEWNSLPLSLRETQDTLAFKTLLREHLWKILLEPMSRTDSRDLLWWISELAAYSYFSVLSLSLALVPLSFSCLVHLLK